MTDSKPRDLTPEELALSQGLAGQETGTAPMRIPPGTQFAIELLDPAAAATASPTAGPNEASGSGR